MSITCQAHAMSWECLDTKKWSHPLPAGAHCLVKGADKENRQTQHSEPRALLVCGWWKRIVQQFAKGALSDWHFLNLRHLVNISEEILNDKSKNIPLRMIHPVARWERPISSTLMSQSWNEDSRPKGKWPCIIRAQWNTPNCAHWDLWLFSCVLTPLTYWMLTPQPRVILRTYLWSECCYSLHFHWLLRSPVTAQNWQLGTSGLGLKRRAP